MNDQQCKSNHQVIKKNILRLESLKQNSKYPCNFVIIFRGYKMIEIKLSTFLELYILCKSDKNVKDITSWDEMSSQCTDAFATLYYELKFHLM